MTKFKPVLTRDQVEAIKDLQNVATSSGVHSLYSILKSVQSTSKDGVYVDCYDSAPHCTLNTLPIADFGAALYGDYEIAPPTPHEKLAEVYEAPPLANDPKMFVEARYYRKGIEAALYILNIKVKGINDYDGGCSTAGDED